METIINSVTGNSIRFLQAEGAVEKRFSTQWRYDCEREALATLLKESSYSPKVISGAGSDPHTALAITMEMIEGASLRDYLSAHPSATPDVFRDLGRLVAQLHTVRLAAPSQRTTVLPLRGAAHFVRVFADLAVECGQDPLAADRFLHQYRDFLDESQFVLLHRDISIDNVMVRATTRELVLLDFENCAWGHPYADVWRLREVEATHIEGAAEAFSSTYFTQGSASDYEHCRGFMEAAFALEMCDLYVKKKITLTSEMHLFVARQVQVFGVMI